MLPFFPYPSLIFKLFEYNKHWFGIMDDSVSKCILGRRNMLAVYASLACLGTERLVLSLKMRSFAVLLLLSAACVRGFRVAPIRRARPLLLRATSSPADPPEKLRQGVRLRMASLGLAGFVETTYLTVQKALGSTAALCSTQGCQEVLTGPFSRAGPIPLTLPGAAAYLGIVILAALPLLWQPASPQREQNVENYSRLGLLVLSTSMAAFSAYLMLVLGLVIKSPCPYCFFSAFCSVTLAVISWRSNGWQKSLKIGSASALLTFALTVPVFLSARAETNLGSPSSVYKIGDDARSARQTVTRSDADLVPTDEDEILELLENAEIDVALEEKRAPKILTKSSKRAMRIAKKLKEGDARFYGAYWCGHCYEQKRRLGAEAMKKVRYFECAKDGQNSDYETCKEKNVPGYPTWEINGELYPGEKTLAELEEILGMM